MHFQVLREKNKTFLLSCSVRDKTTNDIFESNLVKNQKYILIMPSFIFFMMFASSVLTYGVESQKIQENERLYNTLFRYRKRFALF